MARITRATVLLNPTSGLRRNGEPTEMVRAHLLSAGVTDVEIVRLTPRRDPANIITERLRRGTDAIIAAGGDGTVSSVASAIAGSEIPLGVLPLGTLNHFAKDLGIPPELEEAARVIAAGHSILVDVASVNGRVFINNSSIGIYPAMVTVRESLMGKGWPKRLAMFAGVVWALWAFPDTAVHLSTNETGLVARTPFVFVGNNIYELSGFQVGSRKGLHEGLLQVCTVGNASRIALLRTIWCSLVGRQEAAPELHIATAQEARIATRRKRVPVALDGEVITMKSPLVYSTRPSTLRVLAAKQE